MRRRELTKRFLRIGASLVFIWLAVSILLFFFSGTIIYHPKYSLGERYSISYLQEQVTNSSGDKIDLIWIPKGNNYKTYLYLHGNGGRLRFIVEGLAGEGNLLAPAYPGFSRSEGGPDTEVINEVVDLSIEFLRKKGIADQDIVILGHSLGGAPAVYAATRYPEVDRVILVNTFHSVKSMCESRYRIFCLFTGGIHNSAQLAPQARARIRQFHDRSDQIVPYRQGLELFELLGSEDKKFFDLAGTHNDFDVAVVVGKE